MKHLAWTFQLALVFISTALISGCDKEKTVANEPRTSRDYTAPFQIVKFSKASVKVPSGYVRLLNDSLPADLTGQGLTATKTQLLLETLMPGFPTHDQYKDWKNPGGHNEVYIRFSDDPEIKFNPGTEAMINDDAVLRLPIVKAVIGNKYNYDELYDLGLRRYTSTLSPNSDVLYISQDINFRAPNGEIMPILCPARPRSNDKCRVSYVAAESLSVAYSFPPQYLSNWKEIRQFVLDTVQVINWGHTANQGAP